MRKMLLAVAGVALAAGVGVGVVLPVGEPSVKPAVASATPKLQLPLECRSALHLGSEGFGVALNGLAQAKNIVGNTVPNGSTSPALGALGQSNARVEGLVQQYNEAMAACNAAAGAVPAPAQTTH